MTPFLSVPAVIGVLVMWHYKPKTAKNQESDYTEPTRQIVECWPQLALRESSSGGEPLVGPQEELRGPSRYSPTRRGFIASPRWEANSGGNKRTLGRPKVNSLINEIIDSLIERRRFWPVIRGKYFFTALTGQSTHEDLVKKFGLRRILFDKSCLRRILFY